MVLHDLYAACSRKKKKVTKLKVLVENRLKAGLKKRGVTAPGLARVDIFKPFYSLSYICEKNKQDRSLEE